MTDVIVRMRHVRTANICASGSRAWFAKQGWSWSDFLENGISAEKLEATGDAIVCRVAAIARKEFEDGGR